MYIYDLPCYDNRKSFYGKAKIFEQGDKYILYSYDTPVIEYNEKTEEVKRLWDGYSATTMRHVNSFLRHFYLKGGGKKWWNSLAVK